MTPADPHPAPLRSAALLLHAMPQDDRAWMMAALPNGQRDSLAPLLDELESLGIPGDPGLIEELATSEEGIAVPAPRWPQQLDAGEVVVLCDVLAGEPLGLSRFLLAMQSWSWAPHLQARRAALQLVIPGRSSAPCLEEAVLAALKSHCDAVAPGPVAPERIGRWERLKARLAPWRNRP